MRTIIFLASLLLASVCSAQNVTVVHEVAQSTNTIIQTIDVCTANGALDVAAQTSSGTLAGHFSMEVYNLSGSTNSINCGFDPMLSTSTYSVWYGREIAAGIGMVWQKLSNRKLYCMTQNSGGCTRATITQMK